MLDMFKSWYNRMNNYFSQHPMRNSVAHVLTGFGLAVVLLPYLAIGASTLMIIGWAFIIIGLIMHFMALWS